MPPFDKFKRDAPAWCPGLLAFFDMADSKRRNSHLGIAAVDADIQEMERLIRQSVGSEGTAERIAGDKWLAIYKTESLDPLSRLLAAYRKEEECRVGWTATGQKAGEIKVAERTVRAQIVRALHCVYSLVPDAKDLEHAIAELLENNHGLAPDAPVSLNDVAAKRKAGWTSVGRYPDESPFCPFCRGRHIDWEDGDGSVYSGSGTCKSCGAAVEIKQFFIQVIRGTCP